MSLSESRALTGVHPWLAERMRYMGEVLRIWGGVQHYLSGVRSVEKQAELFLNTGSRPVAQPGCSQHQYGYAVDVNYTPVFNFSANIQLTTAQTVEAMAELGKALGLVTVANDAGHFQVFPGAEFRTAFRAIGLCPDPSWWQGILNRINQENFEGFISEIDILLNPPPRRFIGR